MTSESKSSGNRPSPTNFEKFLPWACTEFEVEATVVVVKKLLKEYAPSVASERSKRKSRTKLSKISRAESYYDNNDKSPSFGMSVMAVDKNIVIDTYYDTNSNLAQMKFLNNSLIPRKVMKLIGMIVVYHKNLASVTINSGLRKYSLYELSKVLHLSRITEVCLDNTFVKEANYDILLNENCLKHLSLSKCKINDDVVQNIAAKLECDSPASKTLTALNLSCNRMTDIGAIYLAGMLRTNRQLGYLNLADNMISDRGAICIFNILIEFPMTAREIAESKAKYMLYLRKKNDLVISFIKELKIGDNWKKIIKKKGQKSNTTSVKKNKSCEVYSNIAVIADMEKAHICFADVDRHLLEKAESLAAEKLGPFYDPFVTITTKQETFPDRCLGNNTLGYINFAYNDLSYESLRALLKVVRTQKALNRNPRGLINIVIDGNYMPSSCTEFQEINGILSSYLGSFRHNSIAARKNTQKPTLKI